MENTVTYSYSKQGINGQNGSNGTNGVSVVSVLKTSGPDANNDDTYTITYSNNTTSTFKVHNGNNSTQYYIHYVYADIIGALGSGQIESDRHYSTSQTRKYIGVYVDTTEQDADTFNAANGKSGIVWSQVTGTNGVSPYSLGLDNDFDTIPCNAQGEIPTYNWQANTQHVLTAYNGASAIDFKVLSSLPNNNTGYVVVYEATNVGYVPVTDAISSAVSTYTAYINGLNADKGVITYRLYNGTTQVATAKFEATKNYAGRDGTDAVDYWLTPDVNAIKIAQDSTITPSTINVSFYKQVGQNPAALNANSAYRWYKIGEASTSTTTGTATNGTATITVPSNITSGIVVEFYSGDIIYDRETIATAIDGIDGIDGDSIHIKANADACTALGDGYIGADQNIYFLDSLNPRHFQNAGHVGGPQGEKGDTGDAAISYWLDISSNFHVGELQADDITVTAWKQVGNETAVVDPDSYIRYKFSNET